MVTATAPALSTPNQHAVSHGLLGPRSSTRLPGTMPRSSTSAWAIRFAAASRSAYDQVAAPGACRHGRSGPCSAIDVVEQRGRAVEPVGVVQLRQLEGQLRPLVGRRQVVAAERVDMGGRQQVHPGNVWPVSNDRQECDIRVRRNCPAAAGVGRPAYRGGEHRARVPLLRPAPDRRRRHAVPAGDHRGGLDLRGRRADVPQGRPRGDPAAHRRGDARHQPLPAAGSPGPAAQDHRRPGGVRQRPLRRARPAEERQHLRRRRAADVPGHRHRDRDGQEVRGRAHRRRRRRGDQPRRLRRLHEAQPALLPARAADDVRGEEHRHQPAGPDRALLDARQGRQAGVQVPLHGQGRRLGQQVVPLPGDEGGPQPAADAEVPRREDPLARHGRLPAVPPGRRHRRHQRGVRAEDREVRLARTTSTTSRPRAR